MKQLAIILIIVGSVFFVVFLTGQSNPKKYPPTLTEVRLNVLELKIETLLKEVGFYARGHIHRYSDGKPYRMEY